METRNYRNDTIIEFLNITDRPTFIERLLS